MRCGRRKRGNMAGVMRNEEGGIEQQAFANGWQHTEMARPLEKRCKERHLPLAGGYGPPVGRASRSRQYGRWRRLAAYASSSFFFKHAGWCAGGGRRHGCCKQYFFTLHHTCAFWRRLYNTSRSGEGAAAITNAAYPIPLQQAAVTAARRRRVA